nr:MAG TPA: hypothetical protein [Caudoviricetes sp.]
MKYCNFISCLLYLAVCFLSSCNVIIKIKNGAKNSTICHTTLSSLKN